MLLTIDSLSEVCKKKAQGEPPSLNIVLSIHCCQTSLTCLHSILHLLQCCMSASPSVFTFTMYNFTPLVPRSSGRSESEILKDTNTKKNTRVHAHRILDIYLPGLVIIFSVPSTELAAARDGDGCWWRLLTFICHEFQHKTQSDTANLPLCTATVLPRVLLLLPPATQHAAHAFLKQG